jgi:hypothetical protein
LVLVLVTAEVVAVVDGVKIVLAAMLEIEEVGGAVACVGFGVVAAALFTC